MPRRTVNNTLAIQVRSKPRGNSEAAPIAGSAGSFCAATLRDQGPTTWSKIVLCVA